MMKKFSAFVAALLVCAVASGQLVDSSRIKKKTGGGVTGDTANAVAIAPYRATSAPSSPVTGQLWCDTTTDPCIMKQYDGAAWESLADNSVPIQNDLASFPGSPTDGQVFFTRNPPALYVYDSTNTRWYSIPMPIYQTGANVVDNFTGTTITAPASALTLADNATAGNATAGTKSCKVTFSNSTGGETTMSAASNTVTFTGSHSFDWTSIPTGGTGTTQRRIYCTKAGAAATGPWYWIHTVNDNSTTSVTAHAGLSDANLLRLGPQSNYSAALHARWTVENKTTATTSGGCGSTGSALACSQPNVAMSDANGSTTDPTLRAWVDLTSYNTGSYTLQYRIKLLGITATDQGWANPCFGTARVGTADNAIAYSFCAGHSGGGSGSWTSPLSSTNPVWYTRLGRTAIGGSHGGVLQRAANWPRADATLWVRFIRTNNRCGFTVSGDGRNWAQVASETTTPSETNFSYACTGSNNPTEFEIEVMMFSSGGLYGYIEIDNFTITVN